MTVAGAAGVQVRATAASVVDAVLHGGRSLKAELGKALPALADSRDRALLEAMVFAALRGQATYAQALQDWMPRPPGRRDGILRALLYVGLAQLDGLHLPAHAALAATVDAARALGRAHQSGLVNALLRRAQRDGVAEVDPALAWPQWLRARVQQDWPQQASEIFNASARQAPLWLRVNRGAGTRDDYAQRLLATGITAADPAWPVEGLRLDASLAVADLPGFADGLVSVQDGSAQLVADALAPVPAARVLDACAAPGGKAAHLLERDPTLRLTALDSDARRVRRMEETFARLGLQVETRRGDATVPATWWDGEPYDAVLVDAPCSATGIVRRQPDILLHRRAQDIERLVALQAQLLDALWAVLSPGGVLVYATCSILHAENQDQVAAFLARTPDAVSEPLDDRFGHVAGEGRQRLPGEDGMDGFFYARLRKRAD